MPQPLRLLLVEDEPDDADLLLRDLRRGGYEPSVERVETAEELRSALAGGEWDLAISDWSLPHFDGFAALEIVRAANADLPFILMSGVLGEDRAAEAMVRGAQDFVVKDRRARLLPAIQRELAEARMRREKREGERLSHLLFESANDPLLVHTFDAERGLGPLTAVNSAATDLLGYTREEMLALDAAALLSPGNRDALSLATAELARAGKAVFEATLVAKAGHGVHVEMSVRLVQLGGESLALSIARDLTERKRTEEERRAVVELLRLLNGHNDLHGLLAAVTAYLQSWTGCQAVGVRLRDGDDYPYFETSGFPAEFVETESRLCATDPDGQALLDEQGQVVLECMCGNILRGRFDPALPCFTAHGSFWTNSTTDLLASTSDADRQGQTRNRCQGEGYESVALIPLRAGDATLGLLQLNDRRRGRFTEEGIALLERMAGSIAIAMAQRQSAHALRESEERYRRIVETANEGIWVIDEDQRTTFVNHRMLELLGYTNGEMLGRPVDDFLFEGNPTWLWQRLAACRAGRSERCEQRYRTKDGSERWMLVSATPLTAADGSSIGSFGMLADITERKRAEEELRTSESELRKAQAVANVGSWSWLVQSNQLRWSDQMYRIFGISRDAFAGDLADVIARAIHPDDRAAVEQANLSVIQNSVPTPLEYRVVWPDGTMRVVWAEAGDLTLDEFGNPLILTGIVQDITDRKRAEEALREAEERSRTLAAASFEGVAISDDGRLADVSDQLAAMLGYQPAEMLGRPIADFVAPSWRETVAERVQTGSCEPYEHEALCRDGSVLQVESRARPLLRQGKSCRVTVLRDISERKRAEAETASLQAQLQQAQKLESVGRLAGGVAHDFNNMLGVILGHAELALDELDESHPLHADLTQIHQTAARSAELTAQLLAFARRQTAAPKVLALNATVAGTLTMLRRLIGEDVEVAWLPGPALWSVRMDPAQVDQILTNLCVNARDAIVGVGRITIQTANRSLIDGQAAAALGLAPGDYVVLAVEDDGSGMDEFVLAHLFEPFFTTKEVGHGTGLGLAMVYGIAKQNGGMVRVESTPGAGTTFRIFLPRHAEPDDVDETPPVVRPQRGHGEEILLVEDDMATLRLTQRMLRSLGYVVHAAQAPSAAPELAAEHGNALRLLLTDVVMPGMNGRDLADRVAETCPGIACLFMSGYTADIIAHRGVLDEGVHFLGKPFTLAELAAKVSAALGSCGPAAIE